MATNTKTKNGEKILQAILQEIRLLRNEVMFFFPQENLKDYAHPGRIKNSYRKAIKKNASRRTGMILDYTLRKYALFHSLYLSVLPVVIGYFFISRTSILQSFSKLTTEKTSINKDVRFRKPNI